MRLVLITIIFTLYSLVSAQNAVISMEMLNVLYVGINNPVRIACEGYKSEQLTLKISGHRNKVTHLSENLYMVDVIKDSPTCILYIVKKKNNKVLASYNCVIKTIPKGRARFGKIESNYADLNEILKQDKIEHVSDNYINGITDKIRIIKYSVIIMPKRGSMEEFSFNSDSIPLMFKNKISHLHTGDMLVIQAIRAQMGSSDFPIFPITITITKPNQENFFWIGRIKGQLIIDGQIKPFIYPANEFDLLNVNDLNKHGIWKYWDYNSFTLSYELNHIDSFHFGRKIFSEYYSDSLLEYKVEFINDSTTIYSSFHRNGTLYQNGHVRIENENEKYQGSEFYVDNERPVKKTGYEYHLSKVESPYFPKGKWEIYDSTGYLSMNVEYGIIPDSNRQVQNDFNRDIYYNYLTPNVRFYLIVRNGEYILYSKEGTIIEKILFRNGERVKP